MAALQFTAVSGTVALVASTAKTALQIKAPSNQRVKVLGFRLYTDGTTSTNAPVAVNFNRQSTAGTGSSATLVALEPELTETIQSTGTYNYSSEPTSGAVVRSVFVNSYMGSLGEMFTPGQEIIVGGGDYLGVICTAPASVDIRVELICEE